MSLNYNMKAIYIEENYFSTIKYQTDCNLVLLVHLLIVAEAVKKK